MTHSSSAFYLHNIDTRSTTPFVQKQFKANADGILMFFAKTNLLRVEGKFSEAEEAIDKEYDKYKAKTNNAKTDNAPVVTTEKLEQLITGLVHQQDNKSPDIPAGITVAPISTVIEKFLSHLKMTGGKKAPTVRRQLGCPV